jgi:hypothetical protein
MFPIPSHEQRLLTWRSLARLILEINIGERLPGVIAGNLHAPLRGVCLYFCSNIMTHMH